MTKRKVDTSNMTADLRKQSENPVSCDHVEHIDAAKVEAAESEIHSRRQGVADMEKRIVRKVRAMQWTHIFMIEMQ